MSEKRYEVDGVEVERYMLVFGDEGTRIVDNQTGKELYAIELVDLLNQLVDEKRFCEEMAQNLKSENEQLRKQNNKYVIMMNNNAHLNEMLKEENEQLVKIGLKWQGENPCATCVYPDPSVQKLCCAYVSPILIEEAMESFVQGLCVNYKRIRGL